MRARACGASQHAIEEPTPKRSRSETRDPSSQAQSYGLKKLFRHRPRDVVARATGQGDVDETVGYEPETERDDELAGEHT